MRTQDTYIVALLGAVVGYSIANIEGAVLGALIGFIVGNYLRGTKWVRI